MPPAGGIPLALQIVVKSCPVSLDRVVAHPASFNENDHDLKTGYGEDLPTTHKSAPSSLLKSEAIHPILRA